MNDQESVGLLSPATRNGEHEFSNFPVPDSARPALKGSVDANLGFDVANCEMTEGAGASELVTRGLDWPVVIWIGLVHVLALVAPFFFSWQGVLICAALIFLTGAGGVCMGYHRCLTHGSFKTYRPVRWLLAFLGGLPGVGTTLTWVANHRKHHHYSDKDGDPHSPRDGAWGATCCGSWRIFASGGLRSSWRSMRPII